MKWSLVIGLEVHVQLKTASKLFSRAPTQYGMTPNTQCSFVDAALPGTLPIPNRRAFELAIAFALVTDAQIPERTSFDRKNYFYPDLPKGYQITQHNHPVVLGGHIDILDAQGQKKTIRIHHAHLEEDAGKSLHGEVDTCIDLNRAGVALLEIVSEPDMRSIPEAISYLKKLHQLVRYFDISDGNMQEGSFRADVNVSVRPDEDAPLRTRVEIKNVNSFKFIEKAIAFEYERQVAAYERGEEIIQETRRFNEVTQRTESLRNKESAEDYRYFPDPDLPVILIDQASIDRIRSELGEAPEEKQKRFVDTLKLSDYDAEVLTQDRISADWLDALVHAGVPAKLAANWLMVNLQTLLNKHQALWSEVPFSVAQFADLLKALHEGTLSGPQAKEVLELMWANPQDPQTIIEAHGLKQVGDPAQIQAWIHEVLSAHPTQVLQYKEGQEKLFGFFIGQLMKRSGGTVNPALAQQLMKEALS